MSSISVKKIQQHLTNIIFFLVIFILSGCGDSPSSSDNSIQSKKLLIYCGITMVKPMTELARNFELLHPNVKIVISQGGSQDLYNSLKASRQGDLYLPGSPSYREKNLADGFLGEAKFLGYNQAAIVVAKGNPRSFTADLKSLATTEHSVILCTPQTGSIGRTTKSILSKAGCLQEVMDNTASLTTDSRNLTKTLKDGIADIVINWRATAFWPENKEHVDAIDLPETIAPKKRLMLNLLTFSKEKEMAKKFFDYATSAIGTETFKRYGF